MGIKERVNRPEFEATLADTFYDIFKVAGHPVPAEKLPELKRFVDKLASEFTRKIKIESIEVAKLSAQMTDKAFKNAQAAYDELERRVSVAERKIDKLNSSQDFS